MCDRAEFAGVIIVEVRVRASVLFSAEIPCRMSLWHLPGSDEFQQNNSPALPAHSLTRAGVGNLDRTGSLTALCTGRLYMVTMCGKDLPMLV